MLERTKPHHLRAAPQAAYTDPQVLETELATVFDREWVMVTRAGDLPEPGNYVTARIGRRPIIVMRQNDGSIRAFANYCLHRYAKLLDGCGKTNRIVCPYHSWTYDRTGQLIGVPDREGYQNLNVRELSLHPLACEEFLGFVFVSLRDDLPPVAERLGDLAGYLKAHDIGAYEDRHTVHEEIWDGNWKLVFENFIESYHTTYAHTGSIGPTNPTKLAERGPDREHAHFSIHSNSYRPEDLPEVHNPALPEDEHRKLHVIGLYPNGLAAVDPNFMWWIALEPIAENRTNARWGLSFSPSAMTGMADPLKFVADIVRTIEIATVEDKEMVGRCQEGSAFATPEPGYLHDWLETYIDEFRRYMERMTAA